MTMSHLEISNKEDSMTVIQKACYHVSNGASIAGQRQAVFAAKNIKFVVSLCMDCFSDDIYGDVVQ